MNFPRLLAAAIALAAFAAQAEEPPNIVLVMADDLGWGDLGYAGHEKVKTPNFDALAKEGIRFDNFHAAPVGSPTRGSVLTGRCATRFGCFQSGHTLRPQEITIAEALRTAGYRTGHFGEWNVGSVQAASPVCPGTSGFDEWVSSPGPFGLDPILSDQGKATPFKGDGSDVTVDLALKFIHRCAEAKQRFLALVWFGSPHEPHEALDTDKAAYDGLPAQEAAFYAQISAMDRALGRLRSELKELGLREHTLLWFCSDNGAQPRLGSTGGHRGMKGDVYEGGLLVPALMEWPAHTEEAKRIAAPCATTDIYPTLLEIAEVKMENQPPVDGVNLMPLIDNPDTPRPRPIGFWDRPAPAHLVQTRQWMQDLLKDQAEGREPDEPKRLMPEAAKLGPPAPLNRFPGHAAWLEGNWKLHRIEDSKTHHVTWELYDLAADPAESRALLSEQPERVPAMEGALEAWLETVVHSLNGDDYPKP